MFESDVLTGLLSPGDLVRQPVGTVVIYECTQEGITEADHHVQSYASRAKAKLATTKFYAFNKAGEPQYLLRAEVIVQGKARKRRGRPSGS